MAPIEDPRNLREVGIFLRAIDEKIDKVIATQDKGTNQKSQMFSAIFASVISSCIIGLIFYVVSNNLKVV